MTTKKIVIWGAGRIGRGFIADLFFQAGYQVTFIDQSVKLVDGLNQNGKYSVILADEKEERKVHIITGYQAITTEQVALIQKVIDETDLIAVAVYPEIYPAAAAAIASFIIKRRVTRGNDPIDILLCTNLIHAGPKFQRFLQDAIKDATHLDFLKTRVGLVESLVIRICPDPSPKEVATDPFVVLTNGYPILPVERIAFKASIPEVSTLRLVEDMRAEEMRKIYTYNMCHAVLSYLGNLRGYKYLVECLADEDIKKIALGALQEVSIALQKEYSFSPAEMQIWIDGVINQTNNPAVGDTILRSAADPLRKLNKDDRLIGPALLCIRNGVIPTHLTYAIGAALNYYDINDNASIKLSEIIKSEGIRQAIQQVCGLLKENDDFIDEIVRQYLKILLIYHEDEIAKRAFQLGFEYEKIYHGCGQSVLAAILEATNLFDEEVFRTATGLSGGVGQVTDATCSAYIGASMAIGLFFSRRRKYFNADRADKYKNFELVQHLRDKYIAEYGSITCKDIHCHKYGRAFDLTKKPDQELFEKAGAHGEKGETEVVANAAKWTIQILANEFNNSQEV